MRSPSPHPPPPPPPPPCPSPPHSSMGLGSSHTAPAWNAPVTAGSAATSMPYLGSVGGGHGSRADGGGGWGSGWARQHGHSYPGSSAPIPPATADRALHGPGTGGGGAAGEQQGARHINPLYGEGGGGSTSGQQGSSRTLSAAELEAQGMQLLVAADAAGELQVCVCLYACVYAVTFVLCSHKFLHYINTSLCSPVRF